LHPSIKLFVFDLAGTTVVDDGHVLDAFVGVAAAYDLDADEDALRARMGWHKEAVFAALLREAGRDVATATAMAAEFAQAFAAAVDRAPLRPTRGAPEAIRDLEARGVRVAFQTGFARATADLVLRHMGWADRTSVASDEVARGRPAPDLIRRAMALCGVVDPGAVGVAGDTPSDLQAGHAAGCRHVLGVGCGTHRLDELAQHPHTALLSDLTGLADLIAPHE
jgi:phosphonatase-like hydrolase